ncbi:MAG: hypothetical protein MR577_00440, partial [Collinsella sp.]|nr:hypothetical protein [Collinsella sp.]
MADEHHVVVEVEGVELGELTGAGEDLHDHHAHGHLDVALHGAGDALHDEHRERGDEHGVEDAGLALREAVVVADKNDTPISAKK